ncbi:MAG: energy transducer TonB [Vicinamibacterales bacterium]
MDVDLFVSSDRRSPVSSRHSSVVVVSMAAHIVAVAAIIVISIIAPGVLRSIPLLDVAALDAMRQWKYTPARLNGEPVAVLVTVTVNFVLGR